MNRYDFAFIGCRLIALYWLVSVINILSSLIVGGVVLSISQFTESAIYQLPYLILYLVVVVILWFGANKIARFLLPSVDHHDDNGKVTLVQAQSLAFSAVGLLLLFMSIPEFAGVLMKGYQARQMMGEGGAPYDAAKLFELGLKVILGILLFFGSRGISYLLMRFRR